MLLFMLLNMMAMIGVCYDLCLSYGVQAGACYDLSVNVIEYLLVL